MNPPASPDPSSRPSPSGAGPRALHSWEVSTHRAREIQEELRGRIRLTPPENFSPRMVVGADLSIVRGRDRGYAALVVVDAATLETVDEATAVMEVEFPYVPGLLSFRELPPLAAAWDRLSTRPDVMIFDAHGLAHPRHFGLACHGGLLFDVPSLGVAKSLLVGEHEEPEAEKGAWTEIRLDGEVVGAALRTRAGVKPVYVSPGHRMDLATALEVTLRVSPKYKHPEPIRRAHRLSNKLRGDATRG